MRRRGNEQENRYGKEQDEQIKRRKKKRRKNSAFNHYIILTEHETRARLTMRLSTEKKILTRFAKLIFAALCGLARREGARKSKFLFPRKTRLCYAAEAFHSASLRHKKSRALFISARQYFNSFLRSLVQLVDFLLHFLQRPHAVL